MFEWQDPLSRRNSKSGRMSQAESPVSTESVYGEGYLVNGEVREGTEQLPNRREAVFIQVSKNGRLDFIGRNHGGVFFH